MVHYRMREPDPSAMVLAQNPRTGSYEETKMYSGFNQKEVFLQDKQNFALRFFNPLQVKIGARISFNGITSNEYLVLNPGEDVVLERFLGEQRKMVFDTYTIDASNPAAMKAIEKNGLIEISFYKEKQPYRFNQRLWASNINDYYYNYGGTMSLNSSSGTMSSSFGTTKGTSIGTAGAYLNEQDLSVTNDSLLETGRVEAGDYSNQNLIYTDIEFEFYPFLTYNIKLIPQSQQKQYATVATYTTTGSREVRNYCTGCGYRLRNDNWLYCPKCGEKL